MLLPVAAIAAAPRVRPSTWKLHLIVLCCCLISLAYIGSAASAAILLSEDFEGTNPPAPPANPVLPYNPGSPITGTQAIAVDPTFSPPNDTQNYVEVLYQGVFAFSTKSVDLNTVGIQFTVTVPSLTPLLTLSFDYGVDFGGGPNSRGVIAEFLDSTTGLQVGLTISSPPVTDTTASFTSAPFLLPPGTYDLQFASNTYSSFRGVQLDNIVLTGISVPESERALAVSGGTTLLIAAYCNRRRKRRTSLAVPFVERIKAVRRRASRGARVGKQFWGCSGFPDCRATPEMIAT